MSSATEQSEANKVRKWTDSVGARVGQGMVAASLLLNPATSSAQTPSIVRVAAPSATKPSNDYTADVQDILYRILNSAPPSAVATDRQVCANGDEPGVVAEIRKTTPFLPQPDAPDKCIAVLTRKARDGKLDELYVKLLHDYNARPDITPKQVADGIYGSVMDPNRVPNSYPAFVIIDKAGKNISIPIKNAMAVDAAFKAGFEAKDVPATDPTLALDMDKVKGVTETCLEKEDPKAPDTTKTCATYAYGQGQIAAFNKNHEKSSSR